MELTLINSSDEEKYQCAICKDSELIINRETNSARPCECVKAKRYKKMIENSGISEQFYKKTLDNFEAWNPQVKKVKDTARDYLSKFTGRESLAILGQVGSGKSHITIGVANELMNRMVGVKYIQYLETIPSLKRSAMDEYNYASEINILKNAPVLLIDDLYKGAINEFQGKKSLNNADRKIVFEVINHRYFKDKPIIVSSECSLANLIDLDEAIGSRILEMCKPFIVQVEGIENNYRLR